MKILIFCLLFFTNLSFAQMQFLQLQSNINFGAVFPCNAERKSVNSAAGVTNALQCRVDDGSSVCIFLTAEQTLDTQSFNKNGWRFIEEVHNQYALQLDRNYKSIYGRVVDSGGLGKAYAYELVRMQEGMPVNVKGLWLVSNGKMLRGAVSCAPSNTKYMKQESELFLKSFAVVK